MLTKQLREMERQAQVIEQDNINKHIIRLSDLMECDGMYYVGDLVDMDGSNWVDKNMAQQLLDQLNIDWMSQAGQDTARIFISHK